MRQCYSLMVLLFLMASAIHGQNNVAKEPNSSNEYFFRGLTRQNARDIDGAIADFSKSIELDEASLAAADSDKTKAGLAEAYCQRGQARLQQKHVDEALADFDRAIVLNPRSVVAYQQRALALPFKNHPQDFPSDRDNARKSVGVSPESSAASEINEVSGDSKIAPNSKVYVSGWDNFDQDVRKAIKKRAAALVIVADRANADLEIRAAYSGGATYKTICGIEIAIVPCTRTRNLFGHLTVVNTRTAARVLVLNTELAGDAADAEAEKTSFISPTEQLADILVQTLIKKIGPRPN